MLITMAVYDTEENNRSWMTKASLWSLAHTVDWSRHRLIVVDNASCKATHVLYSAVLRDSIPGHLPFTLLCNTENVGTAAAINRAWRRREPGEHCVKMDNDCVVHQAGWADWMEEVFDRHPSIGICGLKRKDLAESPLAQGAMKSTLRMLPHELGQRWLVVEEVKHVMGTCQGYSSALLDKIGYLTQPGLYGFDDSLASVRARIAGFKCVFLHGFEIDHIDPGGDAYCAEKRALAARDMAEFSATVLAYKSGILPVHYDGGYGATV